MAESMRSSTRPVEGVTLGKYRLLAQLGRGGMAEVYLAVALGAKGVNKLVVLKVLRSHLADDPDFVTMFVDEARIAARLNHGNIVQTYEVVEEASRHFIVMEYLEGRSLAQVEWMLKPERVPLDLSLRIFADALAGLHHAHELRDFEGLPHGLVHRDVSPQNVFITYDGQVKIVDFGIAKAANSPTNHTKEGVIKGKIRYMAPEQVVGVYLDRRADVFAVGVLLWHALTGKRLWDGVADEIAIMHRLVTNSPPLPTAGSIANVPSELDAICSKAMAHSREDRFPTAAAFQDAIEEYLAKHPPIPTSRAVGQFMATRFGDKQLEFQRLVDEQVRLVAVETEGTMTSSSGVRAASRLVPRFVDDCATDSGPLPGTGDDHRTPSSARMRMTAAASIPSPLARTSVPPPLPYAPDPPRRRRGAAVVVGVAAVAIAAFALHARRFPGAGGISGSPREVTRAMVMAPVAAAPPPPATILSAPAVLPPEPAKAPRAATASHGERRDAHAPDDAPAPARTAPLSTRGAATTAHRPTAPPPPPVVEMHPPKKDVDCASPYFIDDQGIKRVRPECI